MTENMLMRVRAEKNPLIEGQRVTFVWYGDSAPRLFADFNGWDAGEGAQLLPGGENTWSYSIDLPMDAYVEYAFVEGEERIADPFNPRKVSNGVGKYNNYFTMPGVSPDKYIRRRPGVPQGTVSAADVQGGPLVVKEKRRVYFYQPPVETACPLLVVYDGQDYLRRAHLTTIVDNLIHEGRIQPIALAMPEHGRQARMIEYGCAEMTLGFLFNCVLPLASERLNLVDPQQNPGAFGILGASMGGLMALYTGLRSPEVFGKVISQSGAFSLPGHDLVVWDLVRCTDPARRKIWMEAGTMEWLLGCNRRMADLMGARDFDFVYHEYQGGHNYTSWRRALVEGLVHLFPPVPQSPAAR